MAIVLGMAAVCALIGGVLYAEADLQTWESFGKGAAGGLVCGAILGLVIAIRR